MAKNSNYSKDEFVPKNPTKYVGKYPIIYRSSWEMSLMRVFDENPAVLHWSSESIQIPYQNPLTGKWTYYLPDFFAVYLDKNNRQHVEVIEIKPLKERPQAFGGPVGGKVSTRTKLTQAINQAKWVAATQFCVKRGWTFRIMDERDLFGSTKKAAKKPK